ncbi:unnamed protein product, partial [Fusarium langsethiae]
MSSHGTRDSPTAATDASEKRKKVRRDYGGKKKEALSALEALVKPTRWPDVRSELGGKSDQTLWATYTLVTDALSKGHNPDSLFVDGTTNSVKTAVKSVWDNLQPKEDTI